MSFQPGIEIGNVIEHTPADFRKMRAFAAGAA